MKVLTLKKKKEDKLCFNLEILSRSSIDEGLENLDQTSFNPQMKDDVL